MRFGALPLPPACILFAVAAWLIVNVTKNTTTAVISHLDGQLQAVEYSNHLQINHV